MGKPVNPDRRSSCLWAVAFAAFFALLALPHAAGAASDTATCTVRIIQARHEAGKFDERLAPFKDQLTSPALAAWKSFSLLEQHALSLHALTPASFAVPGEHQGRLEFLGTVEGHGRQRLRLRWQILDGTARLLSTTFVIDDGGTVLQAGMKHDHGLLVLGLTCKLGS